MRVLIDTHSLIWYVDQDHLLSEAAHAAITDPGNALILSCGLIWEESIKAGSGKLTRSRPFRPWIDRAIADLGLRSLSISVAHADARARPPMHDRDPFDRLLAARWLVECVPLVSADRKLDADGIARLWSADGRASGCVRPRRR